MMYTSLILRCAIDVMMYTISFLQQNLLNSAQSGTLDKAQHASRVEKIAQLGHKAYRCTYEGCERLYTTQHHLKV